MSVIGRRRPVRIEQIAGPSAQRRVGITCGWSYGQRVLFSIVHGDPSRPETSRFQIVEVPLATLWRFKARLLMYFRFASFAAFVLSICASTVDRFWINVGTMLVPFYFNFRIISMLRLFISFGYVFLFF